MINLKDYIIELWSEMSITEMAHDRKAIRDWISHNMKCICENWCLIMYCIKYDNNNQNKNHWKQELLAKFDDFNEMNTKGFDKKRVVVQGIEDSDYNKEFQIEKRLTKIWKKENIKVSVDDFIDLFLSELPVVIKVLCDEIDFYDYVENDFNIK